MMNKKYIHVAGMIGLMILGILIDSLDIWIIKTATAQNPNPFVPLRVYILSNITFILYVVLLLKNFFVQYPGKVASVVYAAIGLIYLLFAIPPLWFIPIPTVLRQLFQFPASPLSYTGLASTLWAVLGLYGVMLRRKE